MGISLRGWHSHFKRSESAQSVESLDPQECRTEASTLSCEVLDVIHEILAPHDVARTGCGGYERSDAYGRTVLRFVPAEFEEDGLRLAGVAEITTDLAPDYSPNFTPFQL